MSKPVGSSLFICGHCLELEIKGMHDTRYCKIASCSNDCQDIAIKGHQTFCRKQAYLRHIEEKSKPTLLRYEDLHVATAAFKTANVDPSPKNLHNCTMAFDQLTEVKRGPILRSMGELKVMVKELEYEVYGPQEDAIRRDCPDLPDDEVQALRRWQNGDDCRIM